MLGVIGGGPAGFFAAITAKLQNPETSVVLLEKSQQVLRKVKVSGGGRCNLTHDCHDPRELVKSYPRGGRELIGAFHRFAPGDIISWFADRGVLLKTEPDGRVFPVSDSSATIVEALKTAAWEAGVEVRTGSGVTGLIFDSKHNRFFLALDNTPSLGVEKILLATGGQTSGGGSGSFELAASLGHSIENPVPSLFTFAIEDPLLEDLPGVSVSAVTLKAQGHGLPPKGLAETGPLLITHQGLSGPAVIRLSAWGARDMARLDYQFSLAVDWCPDFTQSQLDEMLIHWAEKNGKKQASHGPDLPVPRRLWDALLDQNGIPRDRKWAELGKKNRLCLVAALKTSSFRVMGKSLNKEEFVTCGGVRLNEVEFKTMESRLVPGLFFAGEILDIDGLTGGFNFQACWTTGFLAGKGMVSP